MSGLVSFLCPSVSQQNGFPYEDDTEVIVSSDETLIGPSSISSYENLLAEENARLRSLAQPLSMKMSDGSLNSKIHTIYTLAPELEHPTIPLKKSLALVENQMGPGSKKSIFEKRKSIVGLGSKVKFVCFKNDSNPERCFAIKRPITLFQKIFPFHCDYRSNLKRYENNLVIAKKIGSHPNFMKVYGVVIKDRGGRPSKPYLILESLEGVRLRDLPSLSLQQNKNILIQLREACLHLLRIGILPQDANTGNILVTTQGAVKLIDFDQWSLATPYSIHVAKTLYKMMQQIAKRLLLDFKPPPFELLGSDVQERFTASVSTLLEHFSAQFQ